MLLAQVEGFVEVAREGNLSRAAATLFVTQPALTARLQALEHELGAPLFSRSRRGMELTDVGRAFLPYAERALASLREGGELVADLRRGGAGELRLGAAPAISTYVLPGLLVRFTERSPNVRLVVRTGHSEEILDMALRHEIDVGLVRDLRHPLIESRPLYEDELVLVVNRSHPLAREGSIPVERIADARLILFDRTSSYYDLTNAMFRAAGVSPRGVMELDNIDAAKEMVESGLGVALLPHTAVAGELADGSLRTVAISGTPPIRRRIVAIRRADSGPATGITAAFLAVLDEIEDVLAEREARD
ncbi:MAG: LysR family transcriptional regulator [Chloroflexota bacterium]